MELGRSLCPPRLSGSARPAIGVLGAIASAQDAALENQTLADVIAQMPEREVEDDPADK